MSLSSTWKIKCLLLLLFQGAAESHPLELVTLVPVLLDPALHTDRSSLLKWHQVLKGHLKALHRSVWCPGNLLGRASSNKGMIKSTAATKQKPAALGGKYSTCTAGKDGATVRSTVKSIDSSTLLALLMKAGNKAPVSVTSVRERESTPKQQQPSSQTPIQTVLPFSTPQINLVSARLLSAHVRIWLRLSFMVSLLHKTLTVPVRGQLSPHPVWELCYQPAGPLKRVSFSLHLGESFAGLCIKGRQRSFTDKCRISPLSLLCRDHHQPATSCNTPPKGITRPPRVAIGCLLAVRRSQPVWAPAISMCRDKTSLLSLNIWLSTTP